MTKQFHEMKRDAQHWEEGKEDEEKKRSEMEAWKPDATLSSNRTEDLTATDERHRRIDQQGPDWD